MHLKKIKIKNTSRRCNIFVGYCGRLNCHTRIAEGSAKVET